MIDIPRILKEDLDVVSDGLARQNESVETPDMADIVKEVLKNRLNLNFLNRYSDEVRKARYCIPLMAVLMLEQTST